MVSNVTLYLLDDLRDKADNSELYLVFDTWAPYMYYHY